MAPTKSSALAEGTPTSAAQANHAEPGLGHAADAQAFLKDWLAVAVARIPGLVGALLLVEDDAGALVPGARWPEQIADASPYGEAAQRCVDERRDVILPLGDRLVAATPIFSAQRLIGALVFITRGRSEADVHRSIGDMQWGAGWVEALARSRGREAEQAALMRARRALDVVALLAQYEQVDDACAAVAAELARAVGGMRVAIGLVTRERRVKLVSLSQAAWFERKSQQAAALENAMSEAVEQRASLGWPVLEGGEQHVNQAQYQLATAMPGPNGSPGGVLTVPIVAGARAVGAVTWHLPAEAVNSGLLAQVEGIAVVLAPLLARLQDESRWFSGTVPALLRRGWALATDPRRPAFAAGALAILALIGAVALVPVSYKVPARAGIEGQVQRVLAAPFEGFVAEAPVRAGQRVARGDVLARLDDRELSIEQARLESEYTQHSQKVAEAVARHDRAAAAVAGAQLAETEARLAQVAQRLALTRITAPFDGVVVSGDWSQAIGSPIEQGKPLFTLAPLTGYRVVLKVDERDVRDVAAGQRGALILSGMSETRLPFTVRQISVASAEDGANLFRVEADLADLAAQSTRLRPGMEGVGKIEAGERTLLWIATRRAVDWVRVALWQYLP